MKLRALIIFCLSVSRAAAYCDTGAYSFSSTACAMDYYVGENIMHYGEGREDDQIARFWQKLGCWNEGNEMAARVVCEVKGQRYSWADAREDYYQDDPVVFFIPVDGPVRFTKLDAARR